MFPVSLLDLNKVDKHLHLIQLKMPLVFVRDLVLLLMVRIVMYLKVWKLDLLTVDLSLVVNLV